MEESTEIEPGTTNVFADSGYVDADEHFAKAELVYAISRAIKDRQLTQAEVAQLVELDHLKLSRLLKGHFREFSSEQLLNMLSSLGQDIAITVSPSPISEHRRGRITVTTV